PFIYFLVSSCTRDENTYSGIFLNKKTNIFVIGFFTFKIFNKILADFYILNPALIIVIFYFQYIIKTKNNKSFALPKL
ncbi:hypothetical protein PJK51_29610, partial [Mycobacterium kansasii]